VEEGGESDLVRRVAEGDRRALGRLYDRYAGDLFAFALSRLGDRHGAEDAVQETILAAWQGAAGYRGESRVKTWLFAICRNKVLDWPRRREVPTEPEDFRLGGGVGGGEVDLDFWQSFGRLTDEQQEVILLVFHYGFAQEEVAGILGVPLGTVKSRLHYARRRLRELLAE
jgi:RNA polymerase sigma-70 factor (ECF subfamily)